MFVNRCIVWDDQYHSKHIGIHNNGFKVLAEQNCQSARAKNPLNWNDESTFTFQAYFKVILSSKKKRHE